MKIKDEVTEPRGPKTGWASVLIACVLLGFISVIPKPAHGNVASAVGTLTALQADTDGDGIPDDWEIANGLDPNNPADAAMDPDADGMTNLQEYQAGTNPHDASSRFALSANRLNGSVVLTWPFQDAILQTTTLLSDPSTTVWADTPHTSPTTISGSQANIYFRLWKADTATASVNIVGYINLSAAPGSNFICTPLIGNNTVDLVIADPPDGTLLVKDGIENWYFADCGCWDFPEMLLEAGKCFELWNPASPQLILTFVGEVPSAPVMATSPRSQNLLVGTNLQLFAVASGSPSISYQWRFNGTNITNARSNLLALSNVQLTNSGNYDIVMSNSFGMTTSAVAIVKIGTQPIISIQPQSQGAVAGAPVSLSVSGSGSPPLQYQWYFNQTNLIANATNETLLFQPVYATNAGVYQVVLSNSFGIVTSAVATLTVTLLPSPVLTNPQITPDTFTFSFTTVAGIGYEVQYTASLNGPWSTFMGVVAAATGEQISIAALRASSYSSRFYRVRALGSPVYSSNAVGYINLSLTQGWNVTGNPLRTAANLIEELLPSPPDFTSVCKVGGSGLDCAFFDQDFGWDNQTPLRLSPGEGALVQTEIPFTATFVGEVVLGALTNKLPAGLSLCSSIVPQSGPITSALGFPAEEGDTLYQFNPTTQLYRTNTYLSGNWQPSEPVISVGEGFWVELARAKDWVRYFSIDGGIGPGYAITNLPYTGPRIDPVPGRIAPSIIAQPQSRTNAAGTDATFSVLAAGTPPLRYQWVSNGVSIADATNSSVTISNVRSTTGTNYWVVVSNDYGSLPSGTARLTVLPPPCFTVSADQAIYPMGATIALHVSSFECASSNPLPNKVATVYIRTAGTTRTLSTTTDASGIATVNFQPLAGEAGYYEIAAAPPDQLNPPSQDNFKIVGLAFGTASFAKRLTIGTRVTNLVELRNLTDVPLSGLSASLIGAPGNVTLQPTNLDANASNVFQAVVQVSGPATTTPLRLHITSSQGTVNDLTLDLAIAPPLPQLSLSPPSLHTAMLRGTQSFVTFFVTNVGGASSGDLQILLPNADWLNLISPAVIPSLAPDVFGAVTLSLTPTSTLPLGPYFGAIGVWNSSLGQTDVPFQFDCVSGLTGGLKVTVVDEFTSFAVGAPKVTNALVTLLNPYFRTNITSARTDTDGSALFTGLPEGYYEVSVQADQHGGFDTYGLVTGNQTNDVTAFLARQMVSYRWIVTTQAVTDRYIFTLDTRFETEVPAPVVRVEPAALDLCNYSAASNQVILTIFNSGLIAAKSATLTFGSHPNFLIVPLTPDIGDIPAQSSRGVPVTIYRLGSNDGPAQIEAHLDWKLITVAEPQYYRLDIPVFNAGLHDCEPGNPGSAPVSAPPPLFFTGPPPIGGAPPERTGGPPGSSPGLPHVSPPPTFVTRSPDVVPVEIGLQLSQSAMMVRSAFEALLEIDNGSIDPLSNLGVAIDIRDTNGLPANDRFGIRPPQLVGLDAVDGTGHLAAHASGQASWTIIPATNAAPTAPTRYTVGGALTYQQAGHAVRIPLFPVPITVFPDARLVVDYFWEQIVYSDDPFTAEIEPPVPFGVGLRIKNAGFGQATAVRVASAQPQIVDNQSGLAINFQMLGAQVNTQAIAPSLTALLGDVVPGASAVATWWMTASLQGRFINYSASFEHLDDLGKKNLSLVDSIAIHPMVHVARAEFPADDGAPDYLVNDSYNTNYLADHLYLSDGSVSAVTSITNAVSDGAPGAGHTNVHLTLTSPSGWIYLRIPDPNPGTFVLRAVGRSDGRMLLVGTNAWTTHRIVHPVGADPYREDFFHLLDHDSTGLYTLYYDLAPVRPGITNQPVSTTRVVGTTAVFTVGATGTEPLVYQWFKDGVPLIGSVGPTLTINSVQTNDAGAYSVRISNPAGSTNSSEARLIVRTPPTLDPVTDQFLFVGRQLVITNHAHAQENAAPVTFSLDSSSAASATMTSDGVFKWTPACNQGSSTNRMKIWAIDSGIPQLSNSMSFLITVPECVEAALGNTVVQIGHTSSVPVRLVSTVALTNMVFTIPYPADRFTNFTMSVNSPQVLTQSVRLLAIGQLEVSFNLASNSVLHGPTNVGQLAFTASPDQSSAFVFLPITDVQGRKPDGQIVANANGQSGRVVIIGREPLLEAWLDTNAQPLLTLYGNPGITYTVQTATNLTPTITWSNAFNMTLTNLFQSTNWINRGESSRFFRAFGP